MSLIIVDSKYAHDWKTDKVKPPDAPFPNTPYESLMVWLEYWTGQRCTGCGQYWGAPDSTDRCPEKPFP